MTISGARYKPILMVRIKVSTNDKGGFGIKRLKDKENSTKESKEEEEPAKNLQPA